MLTKKIKLFGLLALLSSCGPNAIGWTQDVDDLITREACNITIDKSAISANSDIDISVKIKPVNAAAKSPVFHVYPKAKASE